MRNHPTYRRSRPYDPAVEAMRFILAVVTFGLYCLVRSLFGR